MIPSLFILTSSVCTSLQCLISALTQAGEGGHLFRITCSVVLCGGRDTANKYRCHVGSAPGIWPTLGLPQLAGVCFPGQHCSGALQEHHPGRALHFMHFPGLSHSGSGSQVLHKGTDSVRRAFFALPRSEQFR